jgi:hypothetical protein
MIGRTTPSASTGHWLFKAGSHQRSPCHGGVPIWPVGGRVWEVAGELHDGPDESCNPSLLAVQVERNPSAEQARLRGPACGAANHPGPRRQNSRKRTCAFREIALSCELNRFDVAKCSKTVPESCRLGGRAAGFSGCLGPTPEVCLTGTVAKCSNSLDYHDHHGHHGDRQKALCESGIHANSLLAKDLRKGWLYVS